MEIGVGTGVVAIIALAIVTEYVVDRIKAIVQVKEIGSFQLAPVFALITGIVIAFAANFDFLLALGTDTIPIVGKIITGIIISGGSEVAHELVAKLRESRGV